MKTLELSRHTTRILDAREQTLEAENVLLRRRLALLEAAMASQASESRGDLTPLRQLEAVLSSAPVVLWAIDREGIFVVSQGKGLDVLGLRADEVLGTSVFELYARFPQILDEIRRALDGESIHSQVEVDGLYFDSHYMPRRDDRGEIIGVLGVATVVTEREQARLAYRRSQSRFRTVARVVPVALFQSDSAGQCVYVNRQWTTLTGLTSEQSRGQGWLAALHPDDRVRVVQEWGRAFTAGQPFEIEYRVQRPEGRTVWVLVQAEPDVDESGRLVSYVGAVTDITSRHETEEALRRHALDLETCIEQAPDFILLLDRELRIEFINHVNPGSRRSDVVGAPVSRFLPGYDDATRALFESVFETGRPVTHEFRATRLDGSEGIYISRIGPVRSNADGTIVSLVVIATDATAQKAAEEELRQRQAELAHLSRLTTLGEMATILAHELRTPLQVITDYVGGGIRRLEAPEVDRAAFLEALQSIRRQVERAQDTITGIRNFVSRKSTKFSAVSPATLIESAVSLVQAEARQRHVPVECVLGEQLPPVYGDEIQLQQVLVNLLLNGIEAMEQTPMEQRRLRVQADLDGDARLVISVGDTGCGVPEGSEERIFERFQTTKPRGLGVGLAISRSIAVAHAGQIWARRNDDVGTTFRFRLPVFQGVRGDE